MIIQVINLEHKKDIFKNIDNIITNFDHFCHILPPTLFSTMQGRVVDSPGPTSTDSGSAENFCWVQWPAINSLEWKSY